MSFERIGNLGYIHQSNRSAVSISDYQRLVFFGSKQLIGGRDRPGALVIGDLAFGTVRVGSTQDSSHVLEPNLQLIENSGIQVHTHRRRRTATDEDLPHALHLRQFLLQNRGRVIKHLLLGVKIGCQRQHHDRRVGRIDFAIRKIVRQIGW